MRVYQRKQNTKRDKFVWSNSQWEKVEDTWGILGQGLIVESTAQVSLTLFLNVMSWSPSSNSLSLCIISLGTSYPLLKLQVGRVCGENVHAYISSHYISILLYLKLVYPVVHQPALPECLPTIRETNSIPTCYHNLAQPPLQTPPFSALLSFELVWCWARCLSSLYLATFEKIGIKLLFLGVSGRTKTSQKM